MAYTVYTSEGIVITRAIVGETSLIVRILTNEYGVITVRAENGARSAKFAPSLQIGTQGSYDFVRTRAGFRLVGISPMTAVTARSYIPQSIRFVRMCCFYVSRFVPADEGVVVGLYDLLAQAIAFASRNEWSSNWWNSFRLKVLQLLGYIPHEFEPESSVELDRMMREAESHAQL